MKTFEAYVRVNGYVVKTLIVAESNQDAIFLLKGQYGADNIAHFPREV
jgi:hypothetical protein